MQTRTIAGHAIGVHGTAVPYGFQRLDRGLDNAAVGLAVGRRDEANPACVGFHVRAIHPLCGEAGALVGRGHVVDRSVGKRSCSVLRIASRPTCAPTAAPILNSRPCNSGNNFSAFCPAGVS